MPKRTEKSKSKQQKVIPNSTFSKKEKEISNPKPKLN
jgi:hypothetical protein